MATALLFDTELRQCLNTALCSTTAKQMHSSVGKFYSTLAWSRNLYGTMTNKGLMFNTFLSRRCSPHFDSSFCPSKKWSSSVRTASFLESILLHPKADIIERFVANKAKSAKRLYFERK